MIFLICTVIQVFTCYRVFAVDLLDLEPMEIASGSSRYRKLVSRSPSLRSYDAWAAKCYELGDGWAPTILETEEEFNFLKGAMGLFVSTYDHCAYIGGSTCIPSSDEPIAFSDYESDTSFGYGPLYIGQWRPGPFSVEELRYSPERQSIVTDDIRFSFQFRRFSILCEQECTNCRNRTFATTDSIRDNSLGFSSARGTYRKLIDDILKDYIQWGIMCTELGDGWFPAVLETEREMDFIKFAQRDVRDIRSYRIGGETCVDRNQFINYTQYIPRVGDEDRWVNGVPFHNNVLVSTTNSAGQYDAESFRLQSWTLGQNTYGILCEKTFREEDVGVLATCGQSNP